MSGLKFFKPFVAVVLLAVSCAETSGSQVRIEPARGDGLAAFLVGVVCWALVLRRTPVARLPQGLLIGALTALLAHPVMMALMLALDPRAHARPLAELLRTWLGLTALSLLFAAWWTVPVGAVVGLATVGLARLRARLVS